MAIHKFPSEAADEPHKKHKTTHHFEAIDIEELQGENLFRDQAESLEPNKIAAIELPLFLRVCIFFSALALLAFGLLLFLITIIIAAVNIATFKKIPALDEKMTRSLSWSQSVFGTGFGLLIVPFSAALGINFITLFFLLRKKSFRDSLIDRLFKRF